MMKSWLSCWDDPISHPGMRVNFNPPQANQKQKKRQKIDLLCKIILLMSQGCIKSMCEWASDVKLNSTLSQGKSQKVFFWLAFKWKLWQPCATVKLQWTRSITDKHLTNNQHIKREEFSILQRQNWYQWILVVLWPSELSIIAMCLMREN